MKKNLYKFQVSQARMEFHVSKEIRDKCNFDKSIFALTGNVVLTNFKDVRLFAKKINDTLDPVLESDKMISAGQLNAMGLIDEIFHHVCAIFRKNAKPEVFELLLSELDKRYGEPAVNSMLLEFTNEFPSTSVYSKKITPVAYLNEKVIDTPTNRQITNRVTTLEEIILLHLANENPAFKPFTNLLFKDKNLQINPRYDEVWKITKDFFKGQPSFGPNNCDLITLLKEPVVFSPDSLKGQLDYIRTHWNVILGEWLLRLLSGIDMIQEEEKPGWNGNFSGPPPMDAYNYDSLMKEYERFSPDKDWMPRVVLMAKTVLVWLDQLSKKYDRQIMRLDQIPDEELDLLAKEGFTGLWLIGLWERSNASKRVKQLCGNPEAAASAYSLYDYDIAENLGGWEALSNLRLRLWYRGIRLASDMVPNHTGMDAKWVVEKPDLFVQTRDCPFPTYTFNGEDLSWDGRVGVYLEDHYYQKSDCAVVFKRVDKYTGDTRYIYHGNDGTGMPWNDTAQIDFLNPAAREEVIQEILHVAKNFPIIRFDAAMVLAKKHIRRLWYPEPGQGGDIATRSEHAISRDEFEKRIPTEFWREVVDRVAQEVPDTLLLAEAFWMMEGYFVRTLGMHRVYNSAFMNMLKKEENAKYRATVKNTIEFDPQVLKRFVNFMNNPDEETAEAQFGKDDKYFGVCTLMVTMPGLPMFGHGQIEGFTEKYGMEYTKAYRDEKPDQNLIDRHKRDIFPLMKKRYLFADITDFLFYDVWDNGHINENVFAYSNCFNDEKAVVFYNNIYEQASGWIKTSCRYGVKDTSSESGIKHLSRDVASGLKLTNSDKAFCIFQEQRSRKWYIRSSQEIFKNGLYIHLNGFEYQVLMNINEVIDDETGKYKILCDSLSGRGVEDIDVALKEIFLKDLYLALSNFADYKFISSIARLCNLSDSNSTKAKLPKLIDVLEFTKPKGIDFFETLIVFIKGNYGFSSVVDTTKTGKSVSTTKAWESFCERISKLVKITEKGKKISENTKNDIKSTKPLDATEELFEYLYTGMVERKYCAEILVGFTILYSIRDIIGEKSTAKDIRELINLWGLDRKMRDILSDFVSSSSDLFTIFKTMLEVSKFCDYSLLEKYLPFNAHRIVDSLIHCAVAPAILGVNMYDGTLWFNKEKAENTFWFSAMIFTLLSESSVTSVMQTCKLIKDAQEKSGYNAERFVKLLEPKIKPPKDFVLNILEGKLAGSSKPIKPAKPKSKKTTSTKAKK